ncbi:MAG TPA: VOC family protein [Candidatus Binataceae bacterium]|nr:VOC family protein [Candidatus Binataceae bacterium]
MARGAMSHLALVVNDLLAAIPFYDAILGFIGYARVPVPEATQALMQTRLIAYASPHGSITLRPAKPEFAAMKFHRESAGLNHFAFAAASRADVDAMHAKLKEIGATVLDPPADYAYFPEYYAVYFTDPDGIKFEFAYAPAL